jgi:hypothetical protein
VLSHRCEFGYKPDVIIRNLFINSSSDRYSYLRNRLAENICFNNSEN